MDSRKGFLIGSIWIPYSIHHCVKHYVQIMNIGENYVIIISYQQI